MAVGSFTDGKDFVGVVHGKSSPRFALSGRLKERKGIVFVVRLLDCCMYLGILKLGSAVARGSDDVNPLIYWGGGRVRS